MSYYDEPTNTTYYYQQMVINVTDLNKDANIYILYDQFDKLYYVYGKRNGADSYEKSFEQSVKLYNFICTALNNNKNMGVTVNYVAGMTNFDKYEEIHRKVDDKNIVTPYNNVIMDLSRFGMYLDSYLM